MTPSSSDQQPESEWTQVSIPNIRSRDAFRDQQVAQNTTASKGDICEKTTKNPSLTPTSSLNPTIEPIDLDPSSLPSASTSIDQLLPRSIRNENQSIQLVAESDSSTNFDPQAWKRGLKGTGRGRGKRRINPVPRNDQIQLDSLECRSQNRSDDSNNSRSISSSSYFIDAAFISTTIPHSATLPGPSIQASRRSRSSTRQTNHDKDQKPVSSFPHDHPSNLNRPTSDLGPLSRPSPRASRERKSSPPTWKAYTGKEASSSYRQANEHDHRQDFLQAIKNLRAMARLGKFEWLSASSGNDDDADEPRPGHADLPTSTFNSAIGEDEVGGEDANQAAEDCFLSTGRALGPHPPQNPPDHPSFFSRLLNYIGQVISLKTWQLLGLGGIVFGTGIYAGSLIGRNLSQRNSRILKFFGPA